MSADLTHNLQALQTGLVIELGALLVLLPGVYLFDSMTLRCEAVRLVLMLSIQHVSCRVLVALRDNQPDESSFGVAKTGQLYYLALGLILCVGGIWALASGGLALQAGKQSSSASALVAVALLLGLVLSINVTSHVHVLRYASKEESPVYRGQVSARRTKLLSSLIVQAHVTVAALANRPELSFILDVLGSVLVAGVMLFMGVRICMESLPNVLDTNLDIKDRLKVYEVLTEVIPFRSLLQMRTCRLENQWIAQVELDPAYVRDPAHLEALHKNVIERLALVDINLDLHLLVADRSV